MAKADKNDRVLPELDDSDLDSAVIGCDICGIKFQDGQTYEKHMQGKKHQKKVTATKLMNKDLVNAKNIQDEDDDEDEDDEMHCEVCDKSFSGYIPYAAHMKSSSHAKNTKKQKLRQQLQGIADVVAIDNEESDTDEDGIIPKPFAKCKICQKEFSGPESYKKHLDSAVHKKKEKHQKALQTLKAEDETKECDEKDIFSKCQVCDKSFSGIVPYKIHMKSNVHKKNIEKKKIAEEVKEFWVDDETDPGYVCKECKKVFSDPSAFKSHLANNSHEKQKAKTALMDFLKAYPEIIFVSPLDDKDSEEENDTDEEDADYYLICRLCNFSFSGPEAAKDHVKSKKHLNIKKERKMRKLIKDKNDEHISHNENPGTDRQKNFDENNGHGFEII